MEDMPVEYKYLDGATEISKDNRTYIEETLHSSLRDLIPEMKEAGVYLKVEVAPDGSIAHTHFMNCPASLLQKIEDAITE